MFGYQIVSYDVDIDPKRPARYYHALTDSAFPQVVATLRAELNEPNSIWIGMLFVVEEHRRKGLGKHLLGLVEGLAKHTSREFLSLSVATTNEAAKKLYKQLGFADFAEGHEDYRQYIKKLPNVSPNE